MPLFDELALNRDRIYRLATELVTRFFIIRNNPPLTSSDFSLSRLKKITESIFFSNESKAENTRIRQREIMS